MPLFVIIVVILGALSSETQNSRGRKYILLQGVIYIMYRSYQCHGAYTPDVALKCGNRWQLQSLTPHTGNNYPRFNIYVRAIVRLSGVIPGSNTNRLAL